MIGGGGDPYVAPPWLAPSGKMLKIGDPRSPEIAISESDLPPLVLYCSIIKLAMKEKL